MPSSKQENHCKHLGQWTSCRSAQKILKLEAQSSCHSYSGKQMAFGAYVFKSDQNEDYLPEDIEEKEQKSTK